MVAIGDIPGQSTLREAAESDESDSPKSHSLATTDASGDRFASRMLGLFRSRCITGGDVLCKNAHPLAEKDKNV
jgi:hypothetical protein